MDAPSPVADGAARRARDPRLAAPRSPELRSPPHAEHSDDRNEDHPGRPGPARRSRPADHPVHRGRRHRARHLARVGARVRRGRRRRRTAASARSPGRRCSRARRRSTRPATGCPRRRSTRSATYLVGIKGPLTTPVGGGIRCLNVALRQILDLYVCLRPVRWFPGVPSPVKQPAGRRHGDLPREHGGHLRRHRVEGGVARGAEGDRVPAGRDGRQEDPLPGVVAASASSRSRARAPSASCAPRSTTRSRTSARA